MTTKSVFCCECGHQLILFQNTYSQFPEFYGHSGTSDCNDFVRFEDSVKIYQQSLLQNDLDIALKKLSETKQQVVQIKKQITKHNKQRKKAKK